MKGARRADPGFVWKLNPTQRLQIGVATLRP